MAIRKTLKKNRRRLNSSIKRIRKKLSVISESRWEDSAEYRDLKNKIGYIDLFKYAQWRERSAIFFGFLFMWYAASWQPISVFILAIMASLMGHFHKQTQLLDQLNGEKANNNHNQTTPLITTSVSSEDNSNNNSNDNNYMDYDDDDVDFDQDSDAITTTTKSLTWLLFPQLQQHHHHHHHHQQQQQQQQRISFPSTIIQSVASSIEQVSYNGIISNDTNNNNYDNNSNNNYYELKEFHQATNDITTVRDKSTAHNGYDTFPLLGPVSSFITPIFDITTKPTQDIKDAVDDIVSNESELFLRRSFEINGAAFLLALTQLSAFCIGLKLITWSAKKQASRIKLLYFRSCLHQEVAWFESIDNASGTASSLNALMDKYEDGIGTKMALLSYFLGHVALFSLTAFYQMFSLSLFCMSFILLIGIIIMLVSELQATAMGQHALFDKRSLQLAEEILSAIRTVFAFNGQQKELKRFNTSLKPAYAKSLLKHFYTALDTALSKFSIFACFGAFCFYAMHLFPPYSDVKYDKSTVLAVMRGAEVSIVNILMSIPFMEALQQAKGSIARIYVAIERKSKINPCMSGGSRPRDFLPSIRFHKVDFEYLERSSPRCRSTLPYINLPQTITPVGSISRQTSSINEQDRPISSQAHTKVFIGTRTFSYVPRHESKFTNASSTMVLDNFSLYIEPGKSVAFVGASGSGKSTVLALVQRLYDTCGGAITIGQYNIRDLNVGWLRSQIGVVNQEPRLFDMTIEDNIKLGVVLEDSDYKLDDDLPFASNNKSSAINGLNSSHKAQVVSMKEVEEAARAANAHSFIERLPLGYKTKVGTGGVHLSGGQKQRIAIARALIRKPKILLLDESTSALDSESQTIVQEALEEASKGRTTLIVAHRLTTVKSVDQIVVMNEGRVVEMGKHNELMAMDNGLYRCMYEQQLNEANKRNRTNCRNKRKNRAGGYCKQRYQQAMRTTAPTTTTTIRQSDVSDMKLLKGTTKSNISSTSSISNNLNKITTSIEAIASDKDANKQQQHDDGDIKPATDGGLGDDTIEGEKNKKKGFEKTDGEHFIMSDNRVVDFHNDDDDIEASQDLNHDLNKHYKNEEDDEEEDDDDGDNEDNDGEEQYIEYDDDDGDYDEEEEDGERKMNEDKRLSLWTLLKFIDAPKIGGICALVACFLAGLILPMNLIAHSYLFSAFAYGELDQIGQHLHLFGVAILSISAIVLVISFLQVALPGYVGECISTKLRAKTMKALLEKPIFYFDMDFNSGASLCDRFNNYIVDIQSMAGTRVAIVLQAVSTLMAGAIFGFGQNLRLSLFCLSFALIVLITTIMESRMFQQEVAIQKSYDAEIVHLMADAMSNIKTVASLHQEQYFVMKFKQIIDLKERGVGCFTAWLRTFLTSIKFVMPAMSWSASMYYGCHLLVNKQIDLQTIFIVCPVVLFAVNDTFRALVFLPELLKARKSIDKLYKLNREFSPEIMQSLTLEQKYQQEQKLHQQQLQLQQQQQAVTTKNDNNDTIENHGSSTASPTTNQNNITTSTTTTTTSNNIINNKKSISFHPSEPINDDYKSPKSSNEPGVHNKRHSSISSGIFARRKSSRLNSLVPLSEARGRIDFKEVTFSYPNRPTVLVLDGLTMSISPGESVAIVGESGSGKSTCVALLEKFYDYHGGQLTIDNYDLHYVNQDWMRSQIGLVSQEPTLLSYTIGDNIRYGDNSRYVSMEEVIRAAQTANIHEFIMTLPDQYDTELSTSTYSCQLSGGQKQRIAIARALVRDAPILIFDEATSALDSNNESAVRDALDKARFGKTQLIIAHRLATLNNVDKIIVMRNGKVVEQGTHQQLMEPNSAGHYKRLYERQAQQC